MLTVYIILNLGSIRQNWMLSLLDFVMFFFSRQRKKTDYSTTHFSKIFDLGG